MNDRQRAAFLAELATSGNLIFACSAARVTRTEALHERNQNPEFEVGWRVAEEDAWLAACGRASVYAATR